MSTVQESFGTVITVDGKEIFIDVKQTSRGIILKISEKVRNSKNAVVIPISGAADFQKAITQAMQAGSKITPRPVAAERPPREPRAPTDPELAARQLYVNGLAWETTEAGLASHFAKSSGVKKVTLMTRARGDEILSKGCGIIEFSSPADAHRAAESLNDSELDGRKIRVREDRGASTRN